MLLVFLDCFIKSIYFIARDANRLLPKRFRPSIELEMFNHNVNSLLYRITREHVGHVFKDAKIELSGCFCIFMTRLEERPRDFSKSHGLYIGEDSECFQLPRLIYVRMRTQACAFLQVQEATLLLADKE